MNLFAATFDRINSSYLTEGVSDAAFKDLVSVRVHTNTAVFPVFLKTFLSARLSFYKIKHTCENAKTMTKAGPVSVDKVLIANTSDTREEHSDTD